MRQQVQKLVFGGGALIWWASGYGDGVQRLAGISPVHFACVPGRSLIAKIKLCTVFLLQLFTLHSKGGRVAVAYLTVSAREHLMDPEILGV